MNKDLRQSVANALEQGVSRKDVREMVAKAGWTDKEADEVLGTYVESTLPVAIPKREPITHAKESYLYFMQVISYIALAIAFLILWFQYINLWLPRGAMYPYIYEENSLRELIRVGLSMLIVSLPTFLGVSYAISKHEARMTDRQQNGIKQGALYLGALAASIAAAITLMVTVYMGLNGEATGKFLLKVLAILLVCGVTGFLAWRELRFKKQADAKKHSDTLAA